MNKQMDYKEAANRIEEHMRVHHMAEHPHAQKITEALQLAATVLRSIDALASLPPGGIVDMAETIKCPECNSPLECMVVVGSDESHTGRAERLYHCPSCLSSWSESTDENTGDKQFERYFFG